MLETSKGGKPEGKEPPKEMSMEVRLLLAFLLMGAVMFLTPYFFKAPPTPPAKKTTQQTAGQPQSVTPAAVTAQPAEAAPTESAPATAQRALPPLTIDTDLFHIAFSNQ